MIGLIPLRHTPVRRTLAPWDFTLRRKLVNSAVLKDMADSIVILYCKWGKGVVNTILKL